MQEGVWEQAPNYPQNSPNSNHYLSSNLTDRTNASNSLRSSEMSGQSTYLASRPKFGEHRGLFFRRQPGPDCGQDNLFLLLQMSTDGFIKL